MWRENPGESNQVAMETAGQEWLIGEDSVRRARASRWQKSPEVRVKSGQVSRE
jgi:hypothetical protein